MRKTRQPVPLRNAEARDGNTYRALFALILIGAVAAQARQAPEPERVRVPEVRREVVLSLIADDVAPWVQNRERISYRKHFTTWEERHQTTSNLFVRLREDLERRFFGARPPVLAYVSLEALNFALQSSLSISFHELGHAAGEVPLLRQDRGHVVAALIRQEDQRSGVRLDSVERLNFLRATLGFSHGYTSDSERSIWCVATAQCMRATTRIIGQGLAMEQLFAERQYLRSLRQDSFDAYDLGRYMAPRVHDLYYQLLARKHDDDFHMDPSGFRQWLRYQGYKSPDAQTMIRTSALSLLLSGGTLHSLAGAHRYIGTGERVAASGFTFSPIEGVRLYWPEFSVYLNEDNYAWRTLVPARLGAAFLSLGYEQPLYGNRAKAEWSLGLATAYWHGKRFALEGSTQAALNRTGGTYVGQTLRLAEKEKSGWFLSGTLGTTWGRSNEGMRLMPAASPGDSAFSLAIGLTL
jgi:hypothetical protein